MSIPRDATLLSVVLLTAGACKPAEQPPSGAETMRVLATLHPWRPFEARLSVPSDHAPCAHSAPRSAVQSELQCADSVPTGGEVKDTLRAVGRAVMTTRLGASPDGDHGAGLWLLAGRRPPAIDAAVEHLRRAAQIRPDSAAVLNDLAVAYLLRAEIQHRPGDLVLALDSLEKALAAEPAYGPARFNGALALERLGLCGPAAGAWAAAGAAGGRDAAWKREAAEHAVRSGCDGPDWAKIAAWASGDGGEAPSDLRRLAARSPVELLRRTLDDALPGWAEDELAGRSERARLRLGRVGNIGELLSTRCHDESVRRSVRQAATGGAAARRRLADAFRLLGQAAALQSASRYREARALFAEAASLADDGTPLALWARYGTSSCLVNEGRYPEAQLGLAVLRSASQLGEMPALQARLSWSQGLIQLRTGGFADSRVSFGRATEIYGHMGETVQRGAARALEAESYFALGLGSEAWQARFEALRVLGERPSGPLHNLLMDAAMAAREEAHPHAALAFHNLGLDNARAMQSASRTVEALLWRSKLFASLGRDAEARADIASARAQAPAIPDPAVRARLTADVDDADGGLSASRNPREAVAALSRALDFYRGTDYSWKLPATLLSRARAHLAMGDAGAAESDLEAALEEFERRDHLMPPAVFRYTHFERAQEICDELLRLQLRSGRRELALLTAERARHASWPEPREVSLRMGSRPWEAVPAGMAVVELVTLDDRLLTWVASRGKLRFYDRPLASLRREVEGFERVLASGAASNGEVAARAQKLYQELVAPWIHEVAPATRLVFAPDRFLHSVPFAALRDPRSGRWLAQDFVVSAAPSLQFAIGAEKAGQRLAPAVSALLIGNPRFDPREAATLRDLPGAAAEVREVAKLYPAATVLVGPEASRDHVVAALAQAPVIHYAGHAVANARDPWASFLVLARATDGGSGLLLARDVHALPHVKGRLVVLSACGSASQGQLRAAGFGPMVSAFLATGAESVVASLWSVDDRDTAPLTVELHRGLAAGLPAEDALNRAQRTLIERSPPAPPHLWASFQATGVAHVSNPVEVKGGVPWVR